MLYLYSSVQYRPVPCGNKCHESESGLARNLLIGQIWVLKDTMRRVRRAVEEKHSSAKSFQRAGEVQRER